MHLLDAVWESMVKTLFRSFRMITKQFFWHQKIKKFYSMSFLVSDKGISQIFSNYLFVDKISSLNYLAFGLS